MLMSTLLLRLSSEFHFLGNISKPLHDAAALWPSVFANHFYESLPCEVANIDSCFVDDEL